MSESPMKKQALLIGINEYQILPELKYARQDAEAVEQALKQNYRFSNDEVILLTDARPGLFKPTNRRIIEKHLEKLANQELDLFIFGFWGHGLFRNGQRYFCPLDAIGEDIEELGLPFDTLQRLLSNIKAKNTCMILDCCQKVHDRGESEVLTADDQTVIENAARDIVLKRQEKEPEFVSNVAVLNSCKQGQAAYEWDNRQHGIFTAHLLDALNRRYDSVAQIVGYISKNVEKTALELGKTQTPFYKLEGDITLPADTHSTPLVAGDVFISYRHCNAELVAPIEAELARRGISYFIDRVGVNYGMDYSQAIARAVKGCKVLLFVWTQDANGSADMVREVKMSLDLKKVVIPYKIGSFNAVDHDALYYQLSPISRYEVTRQTQETVVDLVNRVQQALTGNAAPQQKFVLPEKSQDAVIEKPEIEDVNISYTPEQVEPHQTIQYKEIPLPPLPENLLNIQAENRGLKTAIEQLRAFTHESLAQANAALAQAQAQFDAWKERKERLWKSLPQSIRQTLESSISQNPDCSVQSLKISTHSMTNQQYFDFLEQFQCGKKYEQARRELKRVEKERLEKCNGAISAFQKQIEDNNIKFKDDSDIFFTEAIMAVLSAMPNFDDADAPFPEDEILEPLRLLDKYELGWRADVMFSRSHELWECNRPCLIPEQEETEESKCETIDNECTPLQRCFAELSYSGLKEGDKKTVHYDDIEFSFRWCPSGTFMMGAPESEEGRYENEELHQVTLTKGFWMMETPVTQKQWTAIMDDNPSEFQGDNLPVENVSWNDCQEFCRRTGLQLPTEAQWEYACRAGSTEAYAGNLDEMAWYNSNSDSKTHPVGTKKPNAWGLYDMHGNVWEWCEDWFDVYLVTECKESRLSKGVINSFMSSLFGHNSNSSDEKAKIMTDPKGPPSGSLHVNRGGSFSDSSDYCRSAVRSGYEPDDRNCDLGFRCVKGR